METEKEGWRGGEEEEGKGWRDTGSGGERGGADGRTRVEK